MEGILRGNIMEEIAKSLDVRIKFIFVLRFYDVVRKCPEILWLQINKRARMV
jgi:hypothetical protein